MLNEIKKYLELNFTYELPEIIIKQRRSENPKIYKGPGAINQDENGMLILKMYSESSESLTNFFSNNTKVGKILNDSNYYDLSAIDMYGFTWKSERVRIDKHYGGNVNFLS